MKTSTCKNCSVTPDRIHLKAGQTGLQDIDKLLSQIQLVFIKHFFINMSTITTVWCFNSIVCNIFAQRVNVQVRALMQIDFNVK